MLLFDKHPLVLDKQLAVLIGLNEALVLQQVHYWVEINKKNNRNHHEGRYWTYNTIEQWREEFSFWSKETVKRTFKKLRDMDLIIVDNFNTYQMDRTLWYTIDYEKLNDLYKSIGSDSLINNVENDLMEKSNLNQAIPENSSEISTEIYNQSISQSIEYDESKKKSSLQVYLKDRQMGRTTIDDSFISKYESIIHNCELYAVDSKYRDAVAHAIKLLLLDIEKSKRIKIGDNYIPVEIVERDINKLDIFIIRHAINKFTAASERFEIRKPYVHKQN